MINAFLDYVRGIYNERTVMLHRPVFAGNEKQFLNECIDSNFVSSAGEMVAKFEEEFAKFVGAKYAISVTSGTAALHAMLLVAGVRPGTEVITQPVAFVATANAITYCGASPIFVDVDISTLGMSPDALRSFLDTHVVYKNDFAINKVSGRNISACMPMHTFGNPCSVNEIVKICSEFNIPVVEDAAEALGSYIGFQHTGTFGLLGAFSFNGNKIITSGGGGMIVTDNYDLALQLKHITTTAKLAHPYEYIHDQIGFNYRMPNLNAALGLAQMERLQDMLDKKASVHQLYSKFFADYDVQFVTAPKGTTPNYWLNAIILEDLKARNQFLKITNDSGVMTRPIWRLMPKLDPFRHYQTDMMKNALWLEDRLVNIPSSVP